MPFDFACILGLKDEDPSDPFLTFPEFLQPSCNEP